MMLLNIDDIILLIEIYSVSYLNRPTIFLKINEILEFN